ncbi:apolipoprotein D-like [Aphidius gifuensis]|uniref:apolipoprotein D-like n=1 Tax=Aphidius gifuensis TaxID=684658 RepID=UPI001CDD7EF3|nr:apolipoprotein D-like [Aphidius gifuensis]
MKNRESIHFLGTWYEIERTPNQNEINQKCSIIGYKLIPNLPLIAFILSKDKTTGEISRLPASDTPLGQHLARWDFRYPANLQESNGITSILDTDYVNYAIKTLVQQKKDRNSGYMLTVWILSREKTISKDNYNRAMDVLRSNNISPNELQQVDQLGCDNILRNYCY